MSVKILHTACNAEWIGTTDPRSHQEFNTTTASKPSVKPRLLESRIEIRDQAVLVRVLLAAGDPDDPLLDPEGIPPVKASSAVIIGTWVTV